MPLQDKISIISLIVSFITLIATILIPHAIMWMQTYSNLVAEYRSSEYASAVEGIVNFFHDKCGCDISKIPEMYEKCFREEKDWRDTDKNASRLHVQRRLLAQYFFQLDECLRTPFLILQRRKILTDYTRSESHIIKILYLMNLTVENTPEIYKDITIKDHLPRLRKSATKMNKNLLHIMRALG